MWGPVHLWVNVFLFFLTCLRVKEHVRLCVYVCDLPYTR